MDKKCVVVGAAEVYPGDLPEKQPGDLWIAADGGAKALARYGITPDAFIGDLDSADKAPECAETKILPRIKDDTDTAAAVKYALARGYGKIIMAGALGGSRLSHTVANLQLLLYIRNNGAYGEAVCNGTRAFCLLPGESVSFGAAHGYFSLFAVSGEAEADISGALFSGSGIKLSGSFPLGVSNETGGGASVKVISGVVLVITEVE